MMATHWSEAETLELFNIAVKHFPKYVHLKKNGDPEKFFEESFFSNFHNLGRNSKSIKSRLDTIQKKMRKAIKNIDQNDFKSGNIPSDEYSHIGNIDIFNICFEYERLFGKYNNTKEFTKFVSEIASSPYWINVRYNINQSIRSLNTNRTKPIADSELIMISPDKPSNSPQRSHNQLDTKYQTSEKKDNQKHYLKRKVDLIQENIEISDADDSDNDTETRVNSSNKKSKISDDTSNLLNISSDTEETKSKDAKINLTNVLINLTKEYSKTNVILTDISKSLKELVNQRVVFLSCKTSTD